MGKSTGNGALAIWMHHLSQTDWITSYASSSYNGPALKAQAGAIAKNLYQDASAHGYTIMGGACPVSVGVVEQRFLRLSHLLDRRFNGRIHPRWRPWSAELYIWASCR
jgi:hypothetical protein